MAKNYTDYLRLALDNKRNLDQALADKNGKDVLYYRGKMLFNLKQAHKLNPTCIVPASITGSTPVNIESYINTQLANHRATIDRAIAANKKKTSIKKHCLSKEIALKIRRLSTRADQLNFATSAASKKAIKKEIVKDSLSLAGTTLIKAPVMTTAKVLSKVGPLAITIAALPITVLSSLLSATIDVYNGQVSEPETYNKTCIHQMSNTLKDAVKTLSTRTYESVGRF